MGQCQVSNRDALVTEELEFDAAPRPLRFVGKERRYQKLLKQKVATPPIESSSWSGNIRLSTLVSPKHTRFDEEYELTTTTLGSGMNGDVFLGMKKHVALGDHQHVAVKILKKTGLSKQQVRALLKEVDIYVHMDHAHIARLLQVFDEKDCVYLVMEYCSGGTLRQRLTEKGPFGERKTAEVIRQILSAVAYCHNRPSGTVVHRDLKLDNFVYASPEDDSSLKLVDFGLSRVLTSSTPLIVKSAGTLEYMAPEALRLEKHTESCDMWAVGIMAYQLLSGELPFDGANESEIEAAIMNSDLSFSHPAWASVSEDVRIVVQELLCKDARSRPTAAAALSRPWLTKSKRKPSITPDALRQLEAFASEHSLRKAVAAMTIYHADGMTSKAAQLAEEAFQSLDENGDGAVSKVELVEALHSILGIGLERCEWIFDQLDLLGNCQIQRSEFLAAMFGLQLLGEDGTIEKAFRRFDIDGNGKIQSSELACMLGKKFCGMHTKDIFAEMDMNKDRVIDFEEFADKVRAPGSPTTA